MNHASPSHFRISKRFLTTALVVSTLTFSCATPGKRTAIGAGAGAAGGAGIGAIVGGGKGAIIGAGIGAIAGGAVGNRLDKQADELAQVAQTKRTQDGILVNLKNDLLFETGSANLTNEATQQLVSLSAIIAKYPNDQVMITGHTDNTGSAAVNTTLSQQRANAVKDVLLQHAVPPAQVQTEGFGQTKPITTNKTKEGRAKNRRVELYITEAKK